MEEEEEEELVVSLRFRFLPFVDSDMLEASSEEAATVGAKPIAEAPTAEPLAAEAPTAESLAVEDCTIGRVTSLMRSFAFCIVSLLTRIGREVLKTLSPDPFASPWRKTCFNNDASFPASFKMEDISFFPLPVPKILSIGVEKAFLIFDDDEDDDEEEEDEEEDDDDDDDDETTVVAGTASCFLSVVFLSPFKILTRSPNSFFVALSSLLKLLRPFLKDIKE